jgi:biopolymer transport protein ExbD
MAIESRNKIESKFSMSGMTDIVFLLLIFFMITSTLIHPTALKLLLPQSNNQTSAKPLTTVSITKDIEYFVEDRRVDIDDLEQVLQTRIGDNKDIYISLHVDETVDVRYLVRVMNIAKRNEYKLILATRP